MKFPGGDRVRRIMDSLFPASVDPEVVHEETLTAIRAEAEARQQAEEAAARELRLGCAGRLRPYIGRLFLVNNFKWIQLEENAARVSRAILATANFTNDTPIGISAVLSDDRGNHEELLSTVDALEVSLEGDIGQRVFSRPPQYEDSDHWLLSLARSAESAAQHSNLPPSEVGCIAVVSALDMNRQANIPWVPAPGAAFKLTGVSEEARFDWQTISVHPEDEWRAGFQEQMDRLRQDPDSFH